MIEKDYDVGFFGESRHRKELLDRVEREFRMLRKEDIKGIEYSRGLSACKVLFNKSDFHELNMRLYEGMAIGALVTNWVKGIEEAGKDGVHFLTYKTDDEAIEKIQLLLDNDSLREKIAHESREHVLKNHTYEKRLHDMLEFMGRLKK
jgi:spore maturation protein CgeB